MKKITIISTLILVLLALCACNTPPKPVPFQPDLKSPNVQIGEVEMQFNRAFPMPGIRKMSVAVLYFPIEDAVCLRWRMDGVTIHQFWNYDGREEFTKALNQYKTDYEARAFGKSSKKTKKQYGTSTGYVTWQMASFTVLAETANIVDFGYFFVDRAPYFIARQREAYYEDPMSIDSNRTFTEMSMYFTRTQADELAALFDPEFLKTVNLTPTSSGFVPPSRNIDVDEY